MIQLAILILAADPWAVLPTPRFAERVPAPRFEVQVVAEVAGPRWRHIRDELDTVPCPTCPRGMPMQTGLIRSWFFYGERGPWACRFFREDEHIGDYIYDRTPPRWLPRAPGARTGRQNATDKTQLAPAGAGATN